MDGLSLQTLVSAFGPAGLFIAYLVYQSKLQREDADKRRLADIQLALALERFCRRFTGQSLSNKGDGDVHEG